MKQLQLLFWIGLFLSPLVVFVGCIAIAAIRQRFTLKLLLLMVTAACVFMAFVMNAREAARRNDIKNVEWMRAYYLRHRDEFSPQEFNETIQRLDDEAARLGVDK